MPPLWFGSWLRDGRRADASPPSSPARLSPAQRVVRVLQVTRANWSVLPGGRRKGRRETDSEPRG